MAGKKFKIDDYLQEPKLIVKEIFQIPFLTIEQQAGLKSVFENRKTAIKSAHSVGKTFLAALAVLCFILKYKQCKIPTTAPTARQVRDVLWAEINSLYNRANENLKQYKDFNHLGGVMNQREYRIDADRFATGIAVEPGKESVSAVTFQGYHKGRVLVVLDEAIGVHPAIWEAIDGIASSEHAHILAIANPQTTNSRFHSFCYEKDVNLITISALDHPNIVQKKEVIPGAVSYVWVKDKISKWCEVVTAHDKQFHTFDFEGLIYKPNDLFLWKVLGEFPEQATDTLIPLHAIQSAMEREQIKGEDIRYLAIDVARFGNDYSVFAFSVGNNITFKPFYHYDTVKLAGQAIIYINEFKPVKVAVDCDGIGAGVFDVLNEAKNEGRISCELIEIHGGGEPLDIMSKEEYKADQFLNLRSQMYWFFRNDLEGLSIEENEEARDGFASLKYFYNSKGKIQIEKKEELKKRIGRSPDYEDACVYVNFLKYYSTELKFFIMKG